ncbi:MAG TPA: sigma-54-dependent Fis family transcriptional regulator, partial [Nitrospirae bacterium]|nr:sigma-54-dependent Fis family transcriptional regulator [Nitrospirota bacterium]
PYSDGIEILKQIRSNTLDIIVIMLTCDDSAQKAITCMKAGANDYITKPFDIEEVKIIVNNSFASLKLANEINYLRHIYKDFFFDELIGTSEVIMGIKEQIEKLARAHVSTVLITGESGTGKEIIARQLHKSMHGVNQMHCFPFVAINCSAVPEHLLESELFGYEKGAFTDAKTDKKGLFEIAKEGTLLLDEIGDMKQGLQSKLLRVLEERTIRRIGGLNEIPVDVTVIATTNVNLEQLIKNGEFRLDLFYRLNVFSIHVPPFRDRKDDIPLLSRHFLKLFKEKYRNKFIEDFAPETIEIFLSYPWPGNVRELKNMIERLVVLEHVRYIEPSHLPREFFKHLDNSSFSIILPEEGLCLESLERDLIIQALKKTKGNKTLSAKLLNISYDSLRYQIKKYNLE